MSARHDLKTLLAGAALIAVTVISGCQKAGKDGGVNASPNMGPASPSSNANLPGGVVESSFFKSYQFNDWSCSTGKKEFTDRSQYCAALKDDVANNNCAAAMRAMAFKLDCDSANMSQPTEFINKNSSSCRVYGEDTSQGLKFLGNASAQKSFFWDGRSEKIYQLLGGLIKRFGLSYVTMRPISEGMLSVMTLNHRLAEAGIVTSVSTGLGGRLQMSFENESTQKKFVGECVMDESFAPTFSASDVVVCQWKDSSPRARGRVESLRIPWNRASGLEKEITKSPDIGALRIRLSPSEKSIDDEITIEANDIDLHKRILVKARLRAGVDVRHRDSVTGADVQISCAPASKDNK